MTPDPGFPLLLQTERLVLRPLDEVLAQAIDGGLRESDWAEGFPQEGDATVAGMLVAALAAVDAVDEDPGSARVHIDPRWGAWAVRTREGTLIGTAGFHGPPADGEIEVGYGIEPGHRGRGLAGEAVRALLAFAQAAGVRRAIAYVDPRNEPSLRLLARLGFERVPNAARCPDGARTGELELGLTLG